MLIYVCLYTNTTQQETCYHCGLNSLHTAMWSLMVWDGCLQPNKTEKKMKLYVIGIIHKCKNQFFLYEHITFAQNICTWIGTFVDSNQSKLYGTYWCVIRCNGIHYWSHYWFSLQGGQRWGSPALQVVMGARRRDWDTTYNVNDYDTDTITTIAHINTLNHFWEYYWIKV